MDPSLPEDYYALLGVEPGANATQVRRAWRRLALEWHPDRAGPDATARFQRIAAAYQVLSDPRARAAYDRRQRATTGHGVRVSASDARAQARPTETAPTPRAPSAVIWRVSGPLAALMACGIARLAEGDTIDLELNAEEAARGGMVTVSMHVAVRCRACGGERPSCPRCRGTGATDELFSAWLAVRPGTPDGEVLAPTVSLRGMLRPVQFRIRVRPAP